MSRNVLTFKDSKGKTQRIGYKLKNPAVRPPKKATSWAFVPVGGVNVWRSLDNMPVFNNDWALEVDGVSYPLDGLATLNYPRFPRLARLWRKLRKAFRRA